MTEEIVVYLEDMETYLEPKEYQAFLKAKEEGKDVFTCKSNGSSVNYDD